MEDCSIVYFVHCMTNTDPSPTPVAAVPCSTRRTLLPVLYAGSTEVSVQALSPSLSLSLQRWPCLFLLALTLFLFFEAGFFKIFFHMCIILRRPTTSMIYV